MGELLVLTGPPGAGKSTIAGLVVRSFVRAVHMHTDDFYVWITSGFIEPWKPESQDQNATVMNAIAATAHEFAAGGYDVVVDGIVGPWFLDPWLALDRPVSYAVLRPALPEARTRAERRRDHPLQDLGVVDQMHAALADLGVYERHAIDSTGQTAEETASVVLDRLAAGELRLTLS